MLLDKAIYLQRRKTLMEKVNSGLILLLGNGEVGRNYSANEYRFRQDSTFLYFTGLNHPHLVAILDTDNHTTHLFGNDFSMEDLIWLGNQESIKAMAASTGIHNTHALDQVETVLKKAIDQGRTIHFLPPYRLENSIQLQQWLQCSLKEVKSGASATLIQAVVQQRSIKNEVEIAALEDAVDISGAIHLTLMKRAKAGMKEAALAGIAEGIARAEGNGLAYFPIITVQGQTLHNHYDQNTLKSGQMVLADVGAENKLGYAGDITRTFPVGKHFTVQQKEIYQLVLEANETAIAHIGPGVPYRDTHFAAIRVLVEGLKALDLMQGDTETIIVEGAHALFMPHGLGHMIGLDVHDMEDLGEEFVGYTSEIRRSNQFGTAYLRLAKALQIGYTLTVEPGIYFIPALIDDWQKVRKFNQFINYQRLEAYRNFTGIRIEDNVLVTASGCKLLGKPIPKTIEAIEALREG